MIDYATLYFAATSNGFNPTVEQVDLLLREIEGWLALRVNMGSVYLESSGSLTAWPQGTTRFIGNRELEYAVWPRALRNALVSWLGEWS